MKARSRSCTSAASGAKAIFSEWLRPGLHQIVNGLPTAQIEVTDAKISPLRDGERGPQGPQQVLFYVVKDSRHGAPGKRGHCACRRRWADGRSGGFARARLARKSLPRRVRRRRIEPRAAFALPAASGRRGQASQAVELDEILACQRHQLGIAGVVHRLVALDLRQQRRPVLLDTVLEIDLCGV